MSTDSSSNTCAFIVSGQVRCQTAVEAGFAYCAAHLNTLTRANVESCVYQIVQEQLGVDVDEIRPFSHLVDDLGADSLDAVELVMAAEEVFTVEIPDVDAESLHTPTDMTNYLCGALANAGTYWLTNVIDWRKTHESLSNDPLKTQAALRAVVASDLFSEYMKRLSLDRSVVERLFRKALSGAWIHHVTTVPVLGSRNRLERAEMYILTNETVAVFALTHNRIRFHSLPLRSIQFSYELQLGSKGDIKAIEIRSALPEELQIDSPVLTLTSADGIDGALTFLMKVLKNQDRHHGA